MSMRAHTNNVMLNLSQPLIFLLKLYWSKIMFSAMKKKLFNFCVESGLIGCQLANTKLSDTLILVLILVRLATNMQQGARKNTLLRQQSRMTCSESGKC